MDDSVAHGTAAPRMLRKRGQLSPETAAALTAAVYADPRTVAAIARDASIGRQHLYKLMEGKRRPSQRSAWRLIATLSLDGDLAAAMVAEASLDWVAA